MTIAVRSTFDAVHPAGLEVDENGNALDGRARSRVAISRMAAAKRKSKRRKGEAKDEETPRVEPLPPPPSTWRRNGLLFASAIYLAVVWLDAVGSNLPAKLLPRAALYFGQIAALFKWAGEKQIDYRAEGWVCAEKKWVEIDVRPFFPLDADNKENRFYRAVQFYRRDRKVMRALDDYVVRRENARSDRKIGGVRFLSLRIPYPPPGSTIQPYARKELATYPEDQRHDWYWTPKSKRHERCGDRSPAPPKDDEDDRARLPERSPEDER